jgi:UDP:flavonoid glycosyltransferase YjiC (YdhE family)
MSRWGFEYVRRRAGLPKQKLYWPFADDPLRPRTPILCAWSPSVIPPAADWPSNVHVTGYLHNEHDSMYQPPSELQDFLQAGGPPICVSFGSMLNRNAAKIDLVIREAFRQTKNRGIILSGWSNVENKSSTEILYLDAVPHSWLLPRCKLAVHHGGAGTTSAGLRAGIPSIVIPHTADQPFWGSRVHAIGAGPKPIPVKKLSVENLKQAIAESSDAGIRQRAESIGQGLRTEDGVGTSVQWIEKYSNDFLRKNR